MNAPFILIDGQFFKSNEKLFTIDNIGKLLFVETFRAVRNQLIFWEDHLALINFQLQLLNQTTPTFLHHEARELKRQLDRTLVKNKLFKSAQVDLYLFEQNKQVSYLIKTTEIEAARYELNQEGITLAPFSEITKSISSISFLRMGSESYWRIMKASTASPMTELILQNTDQCVLEVAGKNIYLVRANQITTAAAETGVYINPARRMIQLVCHKTGLIFNEEKLVTTTDLLQADEVFLADDISGIQWVKAYEMKRYFNKTSKKIAAEFNRELIQ